MHGNLVMSRPSKGGCAHRWDKPSGDHVEEVNAGAIRPDEAGDAGRNPGSHHRRRQTACIDTWSRVIMSRRAQECEKADPSPTGTVLHHMSENGPLPAICKGGMMHLPPTEYADLLVLVAVDDEFADIS
jgi:hypothetical protein